MGGGGGRGKNIVWKQKILQNNYNIMTTHNKSFIALICLLLFLDANHLQESINKMKDFKKSKRRTLLLQWTMMPKHLPENFGFPLQPVSSEVSSSRRKCKLKLKVSGWFLSITESFLRISSLWDARKCLNGALIASLIYHVDLCSMVKELIF